VKELHIEGIAVIFCWIVVISLYHA